MGCRVFAWVQSRCAGVGVTEDDRRPSKSSTGRTANQVAHANGWRVLPGDRADLGTTRRASLRSSSAQRGPRPVSVGKYSQGGGFMEAGSGVLMGSDPPPETKRSSSEDVGDPTIYRGWTPSMQRLGGVGGGY